MLGAATNTRAINIVMAALLVLIASAGSASARSSSQYRIEGRGWGHGIGMSQYGANGYAERGWTYEQIVRHYFSGTVVAPRPADGPTSLRVLLQSYLDPARIELVSAGVLQQGAASMSLEPGDIVEMRTSGGLLVATRVRGSERTALIPSIGADATVVPAEDGGARILFAADHAQAGTRFRGTLSAHRFEGKISVFNTVPFESYLRGVVPDEMPPSWHAQALRAQAIAARSYALRGLRTDMGWFDVYSDTRSQVYGGLDAEEASTDAAVAETAGMVARVGDAAGEVAQAFFFSTSGGRTAANEHVWGSAPYPYLRSVPSPYEYASSYFQWRGADVRRYTPSQLGAALGVAGSLRSASNTVHPSGYARDVVVRTTTGPSTISATTVQSRLGLRSTFFRIGLLSITAPDAAAAGAYVRISGRAPVTGTTSLLIRDGGATRVVKLAPTGPLGAWSVRARKPASGTLTATMTRAGVAGPRVVVS